MQLTLWTYEGPPHVGAMRIATAMKDVHYVLHAPQGDTYADLLFTMIERLPRRPPVTYTTFQARDLGGDTAELFKTAARDAFERFAPKAMLVGASCTAELIQDDPGGLAKALALPIPVVALELPSYQKKENWGAAETFYQIVRTLAGPAAALRAPGSVRPAREAARRPRCNILGPSALGFRHRDDLREIRSLLAEIGVDVHVTAPLGATPADIARLHEADFNVVMYPEIAGSAAQWLARNLGMPATKTIPIGVGATREFIAEVAALAGVDAAPALTSSESRSTWYAQSVDATYLHGKRVFLFGDATHVVAAARVASEELGFTVCGLGTYSREFAREVREAARKYGVEPLITDDYLEVEAQVEALQPDLVLGSQMERHIAKRLRVPCAVISGPVHVQDFPARHSPQMGFEGANVLFDTWVHPLMMGLEEHLIGMFRGDFEFHEDAAPSHLGGHAAAATPARRHGTRHGGGRPGHSRSQGGLRRADRRGPGPRMPSESCTRFPFSCAARHGATPSATPPTAACRPSPSRPCMTPKRISAAERSMAPAADGSRPSLRVVLVTMDSHLAGAAARAQSTLNRTLPGLSFSVHAAAEWGDNAARLERCRADIAGADIVIATMLFMEDHFQPVLQALRERRDQCDAMVCAMSAAEVMKLTRMGKFTMDGSSSGGPLSFLKRLRGKPQAATEEPGARATAGAKQMKMLRRLPKILRFIPGTAQDVRAYFLTLQYWLAGSEENVANLVQFLVGRYADGPRRGYRELARAGDPVEYPEVGVYHPRMKHSRAVGKLAATLEALPRVATSGKRGTVGLLLMRSYLLADNAGHYDGVITALEARGLRVVPAYATGLDSRPAIEAFFMKDGRASVDAIVSLTGFSLVGGPAYNDARAAEEMLAQLDVPYLSVTPVEFQTLEQWQASERGLLPVEATMMIAIPELDGATGSMVFGGRMDHHEGERAHDMQAHTERADALSARVGKLVDLRRSAKAERKVAAVLFNFPPNAGNIGTAAHLAVFESLYNTLAALQRDGYTVELPAGVDALRERLLKGNAERFGAAANVHARIAVDDHVRRERHLKEIEAQWGAAPGRLQSDGRSIFVLGERFGNVFVGLQPSFGYEGDPMRLLFEKSFAPTHAFSAFYRWLREDFGAQAVLHFGTHGALEFMPGKQCGMSSDCWPDRLIGDLPNVYLYASNNPSEGTIAKRRAAATLVSYLTPPIAQAGLYRGLVELKAALERYRGLEPDASTSERDELAAMIQASAALLDLVPAEPAWAGAGEAEMRITALGDAVLELEYTLIPHGLHVVGKALSPAQRADTLEAVAEATHSLKVPRSAIDALVAGHSPEAALATTDLPRDDASATVLRELAKTGALLAADHEIDGLLRALDGRFIRPAPGGDLLRNPAVLPTGRNVHGFDPFRIPSAYAVRDGARQAAKLLARHQADGHAFPESIALVLWGTDNLKSEGGPIGQALALIGARPRFDSYGRLAGAELMPLAELGRPRVDVVITLSGIFRDLLPLQIKLLAEAAFLAARADEPESQNFIRKHALAYQAAHGCDLETASLRVFGNAEGAYGSNVNHLIDNSRWDDEDELAETYSRRKGFAYGCSGRAVQQTALLQSVLAGVELAYQNLDSVELGVTTVDTYFDTLGGISRAVKRAKKTTQGEAAEMAPVYIGDQTKDADGTVRTLSEQVALETRTRMLNPKWYEGMLEHGYEGVRQIEVHLTNTMGWSATTGQVQPWVYQQLSETFMLDPAMRERLAKLNPTASAKVANRLIEASERNFWKPDANVLEALRRAGEELEDRLEGVYEGSPA